MIAEFKKLKVKLNIFDDDINDIQIYAEEHDDHHEHGSGKKVEDLNGSKIGLEMEIYAQIEDDDEINEDPELNQNDHILFITPTGNQSLDHTIFPTTPASPLELQTLG